MIVDDAFYYVDQLLCETTALN